MKMARLVTLLLLALVAPIAHGRIVWIPSVIGMFPKDVREFGYAGFKSRPPIPMVSAI